MSHELGTMNSDPDHWEKVCHDLKQHIATGLLLSDGSELNGLATEVRSRLQALHLQFERTAELVAILGDEPTGRTHLADLAEVAGGCVDAACTTHRVSFEVAGGDHVVMCEPVLLRRAVGNLVDNACRAATPAGRVRVQVGGNRHERWVEVGDDGPGFGEIASGSGLGLSIVRSAVWACGGRLGIDTGPENGTSVRMTFSAGLLAVRCDS